MKMTTVRKAIALWKELLFGILFALLMSNFLFAQVKFKGIPYTKNYTRQQYNGSPFNWAVVQDARGLIYVANNYFLMEFDGKSWRIIVLPNRTVVRSLAIDEKGKVYVGGQDDFGYLAPDNKGEMHFVSLKSKVEKQYQNFDDVWKIYVTGDGIAFCTSAGIYFLTDDKITFHALNDTILDLCFYANDRLFLTVLNRGIYEFKKGEIVLIPNSDKISKNLISGMLQGTDNELLIVTQNSGLYLYDGYATFTPWVTQADSFLKKNKIVSAAKLSNGYVFGSSYDGLIVVDKKGTPTIHLNKQKGLQDNGVEYIYPDNAGNLWLALRNGVDYAEVNSPFSLYNSQTKISGAAFTSLLQNSRLYLGTSEGLYYKDWIDGQNALNESEFKIIENSEGQTYNLQNINSLLLLSHHNGPYQIIGDKAYKISDHHGIWLFQPLLGKPGYVLCGSYSGLLLYQIINGKIEFKNKIKGFDESSRIMEQDEDGNIWVAHGYKGVYKIHLNDNLSAAEKIEFFNSKNGFPSDVFINVFKINNKLVFAGEHGIYKYNKSKNIFEPHEEFNKLLDRTNHTRKLIEDNEGNIWFSSADEIGVLKKLNNGNYDVSKTIFNKLSGNLVGGFEHITYYDEHTVLIGTNEGFVEYDPSFVDHADRTFSTILRKIECTAANDSLISGGSFSEYTNAASVQPENNSLILNYALNSLRFTYSALCFEDVDRVEYQFMLEGHDKNWSVWTTMTQKEYTNLHEGDYIFRVKAKNIYNRESLEASYKFRVSPPWYRTYWSYTFYLAMLGVALYMVRKMTKIEQQKAMRLKEAEHKEEVLKAEKEIIKLNNEKLEDELNHKSKELTSSAMHIVHAVETNQKIRTQLLDAMESVHDKDALYHFRKILKAIESEISLENNWEQFELHFNQIHQDFLVRLRKEFPLLTHGDIKLCAYLRLNLSSKEIAPLLNLSIRGIEASRYRIRKKMNLSADVNLTEFILRY